MSLKVYYWPFLGRGACLVRLLEHTSTPYEYVSSREEMAKMGSFGGAQGDVFAPPMVVDGDLTLGQSTACCFYLGKKCGLVPKEFNEFKAMQHLADIVDAFELGFGRANEQGPALKRFLEGGRWGALMGNIERGIKGPFFFGAEPSCVDFMLLGHLDWRKASFEQIKEKLGVDAMAAFPKAAAVVEALRATDAYKNYNKLNMPGPLKDEIIAAYND